MELKRETKKKNEYEFTTYYVEIKDNKGEIRKVYLAPISPYGKALLDVLWK